MLAMFRRGMFYTYLSIYLREFLNLSVTETTLYATLPMIMSVIFQNFVWGPISDRIQKRKTFIILGEILAGIGTSLVWFIHLLATDFFIAGYIVIIGLTIIEAFWSMSNIGWSALISDIYPSQERSKMMGQLSSIGGLGRLIGISIGGLLYNNGFGFRNGPLFIVASAVMFISTLPMLFTPEGGIKLDLEFNNKLVNNDQQNDYNKKIFIIFIIALLFINFGRNSISVTYSQYLVLEDGFNVDSVLLSYIANMRSIATLLFGFLAGNFSKKFGDSRTLIMGISLAVLALLVTAMSDNLILIFVGSFLLGTSEVIIIAAAYSIASMLIPATTRGKLFGLYNTTFFLSWGLACTVISGPIIDILIYNGFSDIVSYQVSFIVAAIITSIGLIIIVVLEIALHSKRVSV
ncbi:MAG: MFS transporter [Candidatus Lokiarchaeota archaeon]|nr:MFS transporter [Candidatus Lokiarchaeota archaeon]